MLGTTRRFALSFLFLIAVPACTDSAPVAAPSFDVDRVATADDAGITVMTQNLYVGADVDKVIGALASPDPNDDLPALLFAIQTLGETDFPARADAVADAIAWTRPHVVGLQEVSKIDVDLTGLGQPTVLHLDFLAILQAKLAARGLHYHLAAQVQNITAVPLPGISLVDHDAMLVDAERVVVALASGQNFASNVGVVAPGVELKRGWVTARTTIRGQSYTFVSLHAEADLAGGHLDALRAAQLSEVVGTVAHDERVVIMGDFNDVPGSQMHQVVTGAGFTDVWAAMHPRVIGFTCCHLANLSDHVADFTQRIDYVFARFSGSGKLKGQIDRFGNVPADRVAGPTHPIWPSDHAGVRATLRP
jgi:endonuclease/exonuclease/phosphatase family metal-dependent hydrolase